MTLSDNTNRIQYVDNCGIYYWIIGLIDNRSNDKSELIKKFCIHFNEMYNDSEKLWVKRKISAVPNLSYLQYNNTIKTNMTLVIVNIAEGLINKINNIKDHKLKNLIKNNYSLYLQVCILSAIHGDIRQISIYAFLDPLISSCDIAQNEYCLSRKFSFNIFRNFSFNIFKCFC